MPTYKSRRSGVDLRTMFPPSGEVFDDLSKLETALNQRDALAAALREIAKTRKLDACAAASMQAIAVSALSSQNGNTQ